MSEFLRFKLFDEVWYPFEGQPLKFNIADIYIQESPELIVVHYELERMINPLHIHSISLTEYPNAGHNCDLFLTEQECEEFIKTQPNKD